MTSVKIAESVSFGTLQLGGQPVTIDDGNGMLVFEADLSPDTTYEINFPIWVAGCSVQTVSSSVDGVEFKTNDAETPTDDFTVYKDAPLVWTLNKPDTMRIFTADTTVIFIITPDNGQFPHIKIGVRMDLFTD